MSQTDTLFTITAPVTLFSATGSTPTPKLLPKAGITLRVVNLSTTDAAYFTVGNTSAASVATVAADGSLTSCYAGPGCDFTVTIPGYGDQQKFISAITAGASVSMLFYVGQGA